MESTSLTKDKRWELLHSLWIGWTFTLGFLNWVAFAYIGIRARHKRWVLCALFYATPLILFAIPAGASDSWTNATLSAAMLLGVASVVHAFLVRKEYLLRLELLQQETSNVSVTSRGKKWELLHSLWMAWTFTLGIFSWVAFLYIGFRTKRVRWILWGLLYLVPFIAYLITSEIAPGNGLEQTMVGVMVVAGFFSIVHAFLVRNDYLVRLENRMHQASEEEMSRRHRLEEEYSSQPGDLFTSEGSGDSRPVGSSAIEIEAREANYLESSAEPPPTAAPDLAPVEVRSEAEEAYQEHWVPENYPLPIAYSWSLLTGLWDPRDRYKAQLWHAENMLAYLGSVSLALLDGRDCETAKIDLKKACRGGISFGTWKLIIQLSTKALRHKDHPLASAICRLDIGSEKKTFGADVAALISARNDFHHGRGPLTEEEITIASNEAQERLQRCMETISFLAQYPIRLVQDFEVDRRGEQFWLKCLRLAGDGPGFVQERVRSPKALPRGDLLLELGPQTSRPLHPFILASNCSRCQHRETYFIDQWKTEKGITLMKSFERGHIEERTDVSESLNAIVNEQEEPTTQGLR